jgi:hypothetical protein
MSNPNCLRGVRCGRCLAALIVLTLATGASKIAFAQNAEVPAVVPVTKAPFHLPIFSNQLVTLLNVTIPPGRTAGYHRHERDSAFVIIESARARVQVLGAEPIESQAPQGGVFYAGWANRSVTHQVTNVSANPTWSDLSCFIQIPDASRRLLERRSRRISLCSTTSGFAPGDWCSSLASLLPQSRRTLRAFASL